MVALAVAALTNSSSHEAPSLRSQKTDTFQTYGPHNELHERTEAILDALAGVCAREKSSVVAIGIKMG